MKAAVYSGIGKVEIRDVEPAPPPPGYVVVDTRCSGICGSDLHAYFGRWEQSDRAGGHEAAGVVAEVGQGVDGIVPGDRVTMECFSHDGTCSLCEQGHYNLCAELGGTSGKGHGGFAEYTTMHGSSLYKLPESFTFEQGALIEPLAVSHRAVMQANVRSPDRVVVVGGGTIGLLALAAARAAGARETLITVKYPHQAQAAEALGADQVVDVGKDSVADRVEAWTGGIGADCVIETVGGGGNFDDALSCVRKRGTVVLVAAYFEPQEVNLRTVVWSEARITGSNCYAYSRRERDFDAAIRLIASGEVDVASIVTHRYPLDDIVEAFRVAADKRTGSVKVHVVQG